MITTPLLFVSLIVAGPALQDDERAELAMEPVELELPDGTRRTAFRGTLRVPVVRADSWSEPIGVDVWRFPADEGVPEDRLPIFLLHGGPGWPGMEPKNVDWEDDVAPWTGLGDLVVVGQRGIGTSTDTSCSDHYLPTDPDLPEQERIAHVRAQLEACRNAWEAEFDLTGFNVIEAAGDVNDVRRLLGYERIVLLGGSFGSHWSMAVMRYHPEVVARAVLHGVEGPDHTYDSPAGLLQALERVAAEAEAAPELQGKLPEEGLIEAVRGVIRRVEAEPLEETVDGRKVPIDADGLRGQMMGYTSRVGSRRQVVGWPADMMRLIEGDFFSVARAIDRERRGAGGMPTASFFLLDCGSGITRERHELYSSDPATELLGDVSWYYDVACPVWEVDLGDDFRTGFRTDIPTLMVHGTWDVSTPFTNAIELLPSFADLHFVPVEGGTHGALAEAMEHDPAFEAAVKAFLATGETEALPKSLELPPLQWSTRW